MHCAAHRVVAAEGEGKVGDTAGGIGSGQVLLDPPDGFDEVDAVAVVLGNARADGEDIDIENDVLGGYADAGQETVGPFRNGDFLLVSGCLALFVEGHHDHRGTQTVDFRGLLQETLFSVLEADGVDDAFALGVLQAREDALPVGGVDHQRGLRHGGIVLEGADEGFHRHRPVQHRIVHVDVDDAGAAFDLAGRHLEGGIVISRGDQAGELPGTGDVRPLSDEREIPFDCVDQVGFQSAYRQFFMRLFQRGGGERRNRADMLRRRAAATARDVDDSVHPGHLFRHLRRRLVVPAELVRQSRVRVADDRYVAESRNVLDQRQQLVGPERTVHAESRQRIMPHRREKRLQRLPRQRSSAPVAHGY